MDEITFTDVSTFVFQSTEDESHKTVKLIADEHVPGVTSAEKVLSPDDELIGHVHVLATLYTHAGVIVGPGGVILSA